ncbi:MAG: imidazolonepropionase [Betaproteobacteria bacterium]|nr:imidazolonepropionase [Betaproteobacteria bacterium]
MSRHLLTHCHLATMQGHRDDPLGLIPDGALIWDEAGAAIVWAGAQKDLPSELRAGCEIHDAQGAWVTPGLIDCHTHLVFGGDRSAEFRLRLHGASYEEIARSGGGIASTVAATRQASAEALLTRSLARLDQLLSEGVTTVEIKSGYGLRSADEGKCLQVARQLGQLRPVDIRTTFLGAHALPPEYAGRADAYIDEVLVMLVDLHRQGLIDAVDVFCEKIGFNLEQTERVFRAAHRLGLPVKLHAEQLSDMDGAALAARYAALSCDHLEWLSPSGAQRLAQAGTVAVLLPGAFYFLRETRLPPIGLLRELGIPMALASDCNPGSSPCTSLLIMLSMGCTLFRLTPEEALLGVTRHAARALGLADRGVLAAGRRADLVLWRIDHPVELCYHIGHRPDLQVIQAGLWAGGTGRPA